MTIDDSGPDVTIMPIAWIKGACFALAVIVVGVFMLGRCSMPDIGLPPAVQTAVIRHEVKTVEDTAKVHRLERAAAAAKAREQAAKIIAARAESVAHQLQQTADSLVMAAAVARSAADSAEQYRLAELVRHRQADSLASALLLSRVATAEADQRADSLELAKSIETERADRADQVIAALRPIAEGKTCRVLRVISCPSRTQVAVVAALAGATAVIAARHTSAVRSDQRRTFTLSLSLSHY